MAPVSSGGMNAPPTSPSIVTLTSSDQKSFVVDADVACKSLTVKELLVDVGTENPVLLPGVHSSMLARVLEYCRHHVAHERQAAAAAACTPTSAHGTPPCDAAAAAPSLARATSEELMQWDAAFVRRHVDATLAPPPASMHPPTFARMSSAPPPPSMHPPSSSSAAFPSLERRSAPAYPPPTSGPSSLSSMLSLVDLMSAAHYLNIKPLLDLAASTLVSDHIKDALNVAGHIHGLHMEASHVGKSPEQLHDALDAKHGGFAASAHEEHHHTEAHREHARATEWAVRAALANPLI